MICKLLQKIRKWWRSKLKFVEEAKIYHKELEDGTRMRGGSFLKIIKKGSKNNDDSR